MKKSQAWYDLRNMEIARLRTERRPRMTYREIGEKFEIRPERVRQICLVEEARKRFREHQKEKPVP